MKRLIPLGLTVAGDATGAAPSQRTGTAWRVAIAGVLTVAVAAASARVAPAQQQAAHVQVVPRYGIRELPPLSTVSHNQSRAQGLNALGDVVGSSDTATGADHATLWRLGRGPVDLGTLGGSGRQSGARAINSRGVVVGMSDIAAPDDSLADHAFQWARGRMLNLSPQASSASADDVNEFGTVVGTTWTQGDRRRTESAFFVPPRGSLVALAGAPSFAYHISDRNEVAGSIEAGGSFHAVLWRGRRQADLGRVVPGYSNAEAYAINLFGDVVGETWTTPRARDNGFIRRNGRTVVFPNLPDSRRGTPFVVNNGGLAAGSRGPISPVARATLWRNGQPVDLNAVVPPDSGWTLYIAEDVNDLGQIVGWGAHGSLLRGWLLTPPARTQIANVYAVARRIRSRDQAFQRRVRTVLGGLLRRRNLRNGCRSLSQFVVYARKYRRLAPAERVTLEADVRGIAYQAAKCGRR